MNKGIPTTDSSTMNAKKHKKKPNKPTKFGDNTLLVEKFLLKTNLRKKKIDNRKSKEPSKKENQTK